MYVTKWHIRNKYKIWLHIENFSAYKLVVRVEGENSGGKWFFSSNSLFRSLRGIEKEVETGIHALFGVVGLKCKIIEQDGCIHLSFIKQRISGHANGAISHENFSFQNDPSMTLEGARNRATEQRRGGARAASP
jgi:hypothetical protein